MFDTTLIIPQYNSPELTIQAVQSLRQHDPTPWPVLVVDNGSSPGTLRALQAARLPAVEVIALARPGLTAAWNYAATRCRTPTILFLNNDTRTRGPWVPTLLAEHRISRAILTGVERRCEPHLNPPVELLAGWCLAVDRTAFETVGGFDESMELYFSDTDLQLRLAERFPDRVRTCVQPLPLVHIGHQTTAQLMERRSNWLRDRNRFRSRWVR